MNPPQQKTAENIGTNRRKHVSRGARGSYQHRKKNSRFVLLKWCSHRCMWSSWPEPMKCFQIFVWLMPCVRRPRYIEVTKQFLHFWQSTKQPLYGKGALCAGKSARSGSFTQFQNIPSFHTSRTSPETHAKMQTALGGNRMQTAAADAASQSEVVRMLLPLPSSIFSQLVFVCIPPPSIHWCDVRSTARTVAPSSKRHRRGDSCSGVYYQFYYYIYVASARAHQMLDIEWMHGGKML